MDTTFLRHYAETRGFMLGRPVAPKPTPDGRAVLFLRAQARVPVQSLYEFDIATGQTRELFNPETVLVDVEENLTAEEKARRERKRVSVGGIVHFQLSDDASNVLLSLSGKLYIVERQSGAVRELQTGAGTVLDPQLAPDGRIVAYIRTHDLYVFDLGTGAELRLTNGGTEKVTHGLAEFVAQEEMGRFSGYWWSPDSRFLVYEEADADGVEIWYFTDPVSPEQGPRPCYYPRPGQANIHVRLGVIAVTGGDIVWLNWDTRTYPYLAAVRWDKSGPLTLGVQTRDQKGFLLLRADPTTGKTMPLLTEHDPDWTNLHVDGPRWLADGSFLWSGESTAGPQLEQRAKDGSLRRIVVSAVSGYRELVGVDVENDSIIYQASSDPTQAHFYQLSLGGGEAVALSKEPGVHSASIADNYQIYVRERRSLEAMPTNMVYHRDGTILGQLPTVAEEPPFVPHCQIIKVGGGQGLYCAVLRPHNFDGKKRYPVVVDVYGGPRHSKVLANMGAWLLDQWLANQGFIVVSVDNRGTPGRGRDWERALSKRFGRVPLEDQVAGLEALGQQFPEMDLARVGVHGWSFGGYLAALAVLRRPDVFKAAVAGAPVVDWLDYDTHYTERYLGLPDADAAAYKEASLLTYAADLERPLLLVHGTADDNVYFRHSLKLADALFRAGKDFELLPLSGLTHMIPDPVVSQRLHERLAKFLKRHLGGPEDLFTTLPKQVAKARR